MPKPRTTHGYWIDNRFNITASDLARAARLSGTTAAAIHAGKRPLTLTQADRLATHLGTHLDLLWPNHPPKGTDAPVPHNTEPDTSR